MKINKEKRYNAIEKFFLEKAEEVYNNAVYNKEDPVTALELMMEEYDATLPHELFLIFDKILGENFDGYLSMDKCQYLCKEWNKAIRRVCDALR